MDWGILITNIITILVGCVTGFYVLTRNMTADLKNDIDAVKKDLKNDIDAFEKRMEKSDAKFENRWINLLSEIHRIDKDVHVLKEK